MEWKLEGLSLELTCTVEAPLERVFDALSEPSQVAAWWGPHGFTTPDVSVNLEAGGRYRFTMQAPEGEAFHLSGEFLEVSPPSSLAYTFRWEEPDPDDVETTVRVTLAKVGSGTLVSVAQGAFATDARLELHRSGWTDSLERLREFVESHA
jgi:uncharacterized protein YndB with AHSA1/START domain